MIFLYIIFFFLILRFTVTLFNFISNPKLTSSSRHYSDLVSIIIPPIADEADILRLLRSIRQQDYKNYEVLAGRSVLKNLTLSVSELVRAEPKLHMIDIQESSANANDHSYIDQLSEAAKGEYLLISNPRSTLANGLINNSVHRMKIQQLALLELNSNQIMETPGERLVIPLINYLLLSLVPLRLIRLSDSAAFAVSCGQLRIFNAQIYKQHNWHRLAIGKGTDTEIMKLVKNYGYHAEVLLANGFLHTRMYTGFADAVKGLSSIIVACFGSFASLIVYLLMAIAGPAILAVYLDVELLSFAVTLIVLIRIMISLATGENAWLNVILHPLQILSLVAICIVAGYKQITRPAISKRRNIGY